VKNLKYVEDHAAFQFDRVARFYDSFTFGVDRLSSKHRKDLLRQAKGKILEVGVGTGSSLRDYLPSKKIIAIDISQEMLRRAKKKLKDINVEVELLHQDVQNLSFTDETFDSVFTSWVFCAVTDPIKGLKEVHRVLKRGGALLMLEHIKSKNKELGRLMDRLNPLALRITDNINRDTLENLRKAGFVVRQEKDLVYDIAKAIVAVKQ